MRAHRYLEKRCHHYTHCVRNTNFTLDSVVSLFMKIYGRQKNKLDTGGKSIAIRCYGQRDSKIWECRKLL